RSLNTFRNSISNCLLRGISCRFDVVARHEMTGFYRPETVIPNVEKRINNLHCSSQDHVV
ncbi:hypothetical protein, partial [Solemya velum gill symbiont]|uniref:hypothetical protein n=1 Tax=Solemya velum gill symbiont TaxID=2340 RepID=UPI001C4E192D